jgi:lipopolysaccharide biosynthesis glycosyltransferase
MAVKDNLYTISSQLLPISLLNDLQKKKFQKFKLQYDLDELAFNSGFFVFQTSSLPDEKVFISIVKELYDSFDLISKYADQHILNFYFYKSWKHIGYSYNVPFNVLFKRFPYF